MREDLELVKRLLKGDEAAFRGLFDEFFPRLYRFALVRLNGDADEARDVVQQTFCRAFEKLDSYRGEASLYGWMTRICRNLLIDRARRRNAEPCMLDADDTDSLIVALAEALRAPQQQQPEAEHARDALLGLIRVTLDCLPSHYGNALEWKYIEETSVNEIARRLGVAPKAAESLLTRARNAFKEAMLSMKDSADLMPFEASTSAGRPRHG